MQIPDLGRIVYLLLFEWALVLGPVIPIGLLLVATRWGRDSDRVRKRGSTRVSERVSTVGGWVFMALMALIILAVAQGLPE